MTHPVLPTPDVLGIIGGIELYPKEQNDHIYNLSKPGTPAPYRHQIVENTYSRPQTLDTLFCVVLHPVDVEVVFLNVAPVLLPVSGHGKDDQGEEGAEHVQD